ncbi:Hypothetical protein D9617_3g018600 [Elsinoe fawcettii]|nr:Hypothetical protein D9617_3g018600 [Elsinoe fawcettii]
MDLALHCNNLRCRRELTDAAIVTTCCHIFCENCSDESGLISARLGARNCPACGSSLNSPDDAIRASLNPSEDYKTSILSGLSPTIVMECASRAMSFFNYQAVQEITYQRSVTAQMTGKVHKLTKEITEIVREADEQLQVMGERLNAALNERQEIEQKHHKLIEDYRAKINKYNSLQKRHHTLNAQINTGAVEQAAAQSVDEMMIGASDIIMGPPQRPAQVHMSHNRSPSLVMNQRRSDGGRFGDTMGSGFKRALHNGRGSDGNNTTPIHQRQRPGLSPQNGRGFPTHHGMPNLGPNILQPTPVRQSLRGTDNNIPPGLSHSSQGMSAGLKMGKQTQNVPRSRGSAAGLRNFGSMLNMR